jgi:DNA-binding LacI/PurR family transcriptional regulator
VTIKDIAQMAQVSNGTVSLVEGAEIKEEVFR